MKPQAATDWREDPAAARRSQRTFGATRGTSRGEQERGETIRHT